MSTTEIARTDLSPGFDTPASDSAAHVNTIAAEPASPAWSLAATIAFSRLRNSRRDFGPIRAMATVGWMVGCWLISALNADTSTLAGYSGSVTWLAVAPFCGAKTVAASRKAVETSYATVTGIEPNDRMHIFWHRDGILAFFPIVGDRWRVVADLGHATDDARQVDPTLAEINDLLARRGSPSFVMSGSSTTCWSAPARVASR